MRDREAVSEVGEDDDPTDPVAEVAGQPKRPGLHQLGHLLVDPNEAENGRGGDERVDHDVEPTEHPDLPVEDLHRVLPHVEAEDDHLVPEEKMFKR